MPMKIATNHQPRPLRALYEIPAKAAEWFDYIEGEDAHSPRLFEYRGEWYDCHAFERTDSTLGYRPELIDEGWDFVQTDSAFSAVVFNYTLDLDAVVVGRATW